MIAKTVVFSCVTCTTWMYLSRVESNRLKKKLTLSFYFFISKLKTTFLTCSLQVEVEASCKIKFKFKKKTNEENAVLSWMSRESRWTFILIYPVKSPARRAENCSGSDWSLRAGASEIKFEKSEIRIRIRIQLCAQELGLALLVLFESWTEDETRSRAGDSEAPHPRFTSSSWRFNSPAGQ